MKSLLIMPCMKDTLNKLSVEIHDFEFKESISNICFSLGGGDTTFHKRYAAFELFDTICAMDLFNEYTINDEGECIIFVDPDPHTATLETDDRQIYFSDWWDDLSKPQFCAELIRFELAKSAQSFTKELETGTTKRPKLTPKQRRILRSHLEKDVA